MILADLRSAWRSLKRSPLFVVVATLTLGIGIGLTTTMLSMLRAITHPYLPFEKPAQLFGVTAYGGGGGVSQREKQWALIEGTRSFQGITSASIGLEDPIFAEGREFFGDVVRAGAGYFDVLRAPVEVGRVLGAGDENSAVIGYGLWQRAFASRPLNRGLSVTVYGRTYQVVGVMPREMRTNQVTQKYASVWIPLAQGAVGGPIVRLRDDVTREMTYAELAVIANRLKAVYGPGRPAFQFRLDSFQPEPRLLSDYHKALGGAAIAILLIACANLANLMLVRGLSRRKELSLRMALGAGRRALVRQLLTESAIVGALGGIAGIVLTVWGVGILRSQFPSQGSWFGFVAPYLSWTAFATAIAVTAGAVLVFGLAPAILASQVQLNEPLKETSGTTSRRTRRTYALVVVAEMALCLALLMSAGILLRAASSAERFDFGYETAGLQASAVGAIVNTASSGQRQQNDPAAFRRTLERLGRMEGVRAVTTYSIEMYGPAVLASDLGGETTYFGAGSYNRVGWNFLRTLGVPVIKGRDFELGDEQGGEPVAIVDETAAQALWPGEDPVGRMVKLARSNIVGQWARVIGVSRHITLGSLVGSPNEMDVALVMVVRPGPLASGYLLARVDGNADMVSARMNQVVREELPNAGFTIGFQSWLVNWQRQVGGRLTLASLFGFFGLLAVGLAAVGLYGVLAYSVGQRMREFALRVALGALPRDLQRLVIRDGALMILGGIALGPVLGMAGSQLLEFWLWDISPTDVVSLVGAEIALLLVAFAACYGPARRAAKADPLQIIRAS